MTLRTAPVLDRLIEVSAASSITTFVQDVLRYATYRQNLRTELPVDSFNHPLLGVWGAERPSGEIVNPTRAFDLLDAEHLMFSFTTSDQISGEYITLPTIIPYVYLIDPADASNWLRWTIFSFGEIHDGYTVQFNITTGEITRDFQLDAGPTASLGLENLGTQQRATHITEKIVWAKLSERGASPGLVGLGQDERLIIEQAEFMIRHDISLAFGGNVTDDLGRIWTIESSRNAGGRGRYLILECTRTVTG